MEDVRPLPSFRTVEDVMLIYLRDNGQYYSLSNTTLKVVIREVVSMFPDLSATEFDSLCLEQYQLYSIHLRNCLNMNLPIVFVREPQKLVETRTFFEN